MMPRTTLTSLAVALACCFAAASCSDEGSATPVVDEAAASPSEETSPSTDGDAEPSEDTEYGNEDETSTPPSETDVEINPNGGYWPAGVVADSDSRLGEVVTDADGFTLYRFDEDTADPSTTACEGDCATTWPPVLTRNEIVYTGIDASLLGTLTREDGSVQVTLAGWPLYRFSGDTEAGDTNGEAVGGTWFTAAPDGTKANGES